MSRTEGPPSTIVGHPMALPTLLVVGGWALLIGGYLPGQSGRSEAPDLAGPPPPMLHPSTVPYPYAYPEPAPDPAPPPSPPTVIDTRGGDGPIRLTIEFPNRSGDSASIVINDSRSTPEPTEDREATLTASRIDPGIEPPPIPGPPPGFDPIILSPLMPDSVPLSAEPLPILGGKDATNPLLAKPLDELPESFEPRSLLDRHRERLESSAKADPGDAFGDRAPAPPAPPEIDPMGDLERDLLATRPKPIEILPDPEPLPDSNPPAPAPVATAAMVEPPPAPDPPPTDRARSGVLGRLFGNRDQPHRRRYPSRPESVVPDSFGVGLESPVGPVTPSDVLVQTDQLFRGGPPAESPAPTPPPIPEPSPVVGSTFEGGPNSNPVADASALLPIEDVPVAPVPVPAETVGPPGVRSSIPRSPSNSTLVRKVHLPIPKIDPTLLQSRIEEEARARAAASTRAEDPITDHEASMDRE